MAGDAAAARSAAAAASVSTDGSAGTARTAAAAASASTAGGAAHARSAAAAASASTGGGAPHARSAPASTGGSAAGASTAAEASLTNCKEQAPTSGRKTMACLGLLTLTATSSSASEMRDYSKGVGTRALGRCFVCFILWIYATWKILTKSG